LLLIGAAVGGCSKGEDATNVSTASDGAAAPVRNGDAKAASSPIASSPATATNVTPAAAVQPVVQADPIVIMHTSVGDLYVRLYEKQAPRTVSNFLGYVRSRFYDFTIFHQVEPGYVAMGGAFNEQKQAKSTRYPIPNEATNGLKNVRGSLAMTRDPKDPNSATSHFFFNLADNAKLDHRSTQPDEFGYCVFGQVIDGLDVLEKLSSPSGTPVVIHMMRVVVMPRDDQVKPASNQSSQVDRTLEMPVKFDATRFEPQQFSFYTSMAR
jgi:cyclophilin family peptidyl-prolyl cis-trans isomerase